MVKSRGDGKVLAVLRNNNYLLLWLGLLISSIGTSFNSVSLYFLLLETSDSTGALFGLFLLNALVYLLLAPFTGVLVDSWNRRHTMMVSDLARAALVLFIPLSTQLWQIYLISVFISIFTLLADPARNSFLPRVLESRKELLFIGNSFMTTSTSIAETIGFFSGGLFVVAFGYLAAFYLDAASFVLSALCVLFMTVAEPAKQGSIEIKEIVTGFTQKIKEGVRLVLSVGKLRSLYSYYFLFATAFGAGNFLFPILIEDGYRLGADAFGYFSGTMTAGYLIGSFIVGSLGDRFNRFRLFTGAVLIIGLSAMCLGFANSFASIMPWAFLMGFLNPITVVFSRAFIQEEIVEQQLGRVFSLFELVMQVGMMLSLALAFGLLQVYDSRAVVLVLGSLTILVALGGPAVTKLARYYKPGADDPSEGTEMSLPG